MIKVLFVCLGNICRSLMAEFIFKDIVKKEGLDRSFIIDSAATSSEEIGNGIYYLAKEKLDEMGIPYTNHRARKISKLDYEKYDYIIGMEQRNVDNIKWILGLKEDDKKVYKLLEFSDNPRDISDPWYTGNFTKAYNDILEGCLGLLKFIKENNNSI